MNLLWCVSTPFGALLSPFLSIFSFLLFRFYIDWVERSAKEKREERGEGPGEVEEAGDSYFSNAPDSAGEKWEREEAGAAWEIFFAREVARGRRRESEREEVGMEGNALD